MTSAVDPHEYSVEELRAFVSAGGELEAEHALWLLARVDTLQSELCRETERCARFCDEVALASSRTAGEKALARQLAKRMREGRP